MRPSDPIYGRGSARPEKFVDPPVLLLAAERWREEIGMRFVKFPLEQLNGLRFRLRAGERFGYLVNLDGEGPRYIDQLHKGTASRKGMDLLHHLVELVHHR